MHYRVLYIGIFFWTLCHCGISARILTIFGFHAPSQYALIEPLLQNLARRGHHVTSITNIGQNQPMDNLWEIIIPENLNFYNGE